MSSTLRAVITVVLCVAILFIWQRFFLPVPDPSQTKEAVSDAENPSTENAETEASTVKKTAAGESNEPAERRPVSAANAKDEFRAGHKGKSTLSETVEGEHVELDLDHARAVFTTNGGTLRHWTLKHPRFVESVHEKTVPVDLVQTKAGKGPWPLGTRFAADDSVFVPENAKYELISRDKRNIRYRWQSEQLLVEKHYRADLHRPLVWMTLSMKNRSTKPIRGRLEMKLYGRKHDHATSMGITNPYPPVSSGLCFVNETISRRSVDAIRGEGSGCASGGGCNTESGPISQIGNVSWVGTDDRYFLTALVPLTDKDELERRCEVRNDPKDENIIDVSLLFSETELSAGGSVERKFAVYVGPKELKQLDLVEVSKGHGANLGEAIEFGWFGVLCRPMLWMMDLFHRWTGNWGVAIILLTIFIKLLTLYWTQKSMRSMKDMQRLKPKMDELRERFKNDKQRLNQEVMNLYRTYKVNPLGGCLPMLIQMPIWFALYRTLGISVDLYRSEFIFWITDLTAPDRFFILPVAMGATMFLQQHITPQPMDPAQAKMFKYFMPGMFTVMMLWLPSGLNLYMFINNVLTMGHQYYMNKQDPPLSVAGNSSTENNKKIKEGVTKQRGGVQDSTAQANEHATANGKPQRRKRKPTRT